MIRLLLLAMAASQAAAARGLLGKPIRALQDGGNYCTFSPNAICYPSGWPSCCGVDLGASCPEEQPPCDYCEVGPAANASLGCGTPGQFCQLEMGVCNNEADIHPGVCVETPIMCTMDMNPACGCDGRNYSNPCEAWSMGVSVSSMGECGEDGGVEFVETSLTSVPLLGSSYCTYSPNITCYPSGWPTCCGVDSGASCPEDQPPCDYCEVGPVANASLGCGTPGQFCQLEMGVCNNEADIHPGVCVETPIMCTMDMNPACGCDGKNYSNACGAWSMGVSVSSMGECGEDGGVEFVETSSTSVPLLGSSYCTYSPNTSCYPSGWPTCCGVDSGASCPEEQPPCDYCEVGPAANASLGCGTPGQFCQLEMGVCNNEADIHPGVCVETPIMCTMDMNPACGCDGRNYSNPCEAWSMGVSVSRMGECSVIPEEGGVIFAEPTPTSVPLLGSSYCTYGPNMTCYEDGWPSCCRSDNATCPDDQPPCEVTDGDKTLNSAEGTDASAASVLSTFSFVTAVVAVTVCATFII